MTMNRLSEGTVLSSDLFEGRVLAFSVFFDQNYLFQHRLVSSFFFFVERDVVNLLCAGFNERDNPPVNVVQLSQCFEVSCALVCTALPVHSVLKALFFSKPIFVVLPDQEGGFFLLWPTVNTKVLGPAVPGLLGSHDLIG